MRGSALSPRAIVLGIVALLAATGGRAEAQFSWVSVPARIIQLTFQQATTCAAENVVEYPAVPGATLYQITVIHVASGLPAVNRDGPPFDYHYGDQYPPAGYLWNGLGGNAGLTCAQAVAAAADDWRDPEVLALVPVNPLEATLAVDPADIGVGAKFTATMTVHNGGTTPVTAVQPAALPTLEGDGEIRLLEGPTPATVESLAGGASATFTWRYEATVAGTAVLKAQVQGQSGQGTTLTVDAKCGLGGSPAVAAIPRDAGTCPLDGKGAVVKIAPCSITIDTWVNEGVNSDDLTLTKLGADSPPPEGDHNYPAGGT